jgi:hypothetical protein
LVWKNGRADSHIDRDKLNSRWRQVEVRLDQIAAAPGLDQELCRAEVFPGQQRTPRCAPLILRYPK